MNTITAGATERTQRLADAILADRSGDQPARTDIIACFMCRTGMVYRGNRFCSDRLCRAFYDTGEPAPEQDWRRPRTVGYRDRFGREMKATTNGFKIACAHCRSEFESFGKRCCSPECSTEYCRPKDKRKPPPPIWIQHYTIEVSGKAYWRPGGALRRLGFKNVALGFDGLEARARAQALNDEVRQASNVSVALVSDMQETPILRASLCVSEAETDETPEEAA